MLISIRVFFDLIVLPTDGGIVSWTTFEWKTFAAHFPTVRLRNFVLVGIRSTNESSLNRIERTETKVYRNTVDSVWLDINSPKASLCGPPRIINSAIWLDPSHL